MEIYASARDFMAKNGNPRQWGSTGWPPEALIRRDISAGKSYVCESEGRVIGTFFYDHGLQIEPTYQVIEDGKWLEESAYGVVHRLAGDGSKRGIGAFCLKWALRQSGHIRIDTHGDNKVMQKLLERLGFTHCGTIFVQEDKDPRLAYEKILKPIEFRHAE